MPPLLQGIYFSGNVDFGDFPGLWEAANCSFPKSRLIMSY